MQILQLLPDFADLLLPPAVGGVRLRRVLRMFPKVPVRVIELSFLLFELGDPGAHLKRRRHLENFGRNAASLYSEGAASLSFRN